MEIKFLMMSLRALRLPLCYQESRGWVEFLKRNGIKSTVDKTFIGNRELNKNSQKGNVISRLIPENHKECRRESQGESGAAKLLWLLRAGVFLQQSQQTLWDVSLLVFHSPLKYSIPSLAMAFKKSQFLHHTGNNFKSYVCRAFWAFGMYTSQVLTSTLPISNGPL